MSQNFNVRRLKSSDNAAFAQVIRSGPVFSQSVLVPDHNLDFYKFIGDSEPLFWGAVLSTQPQRLVGVAGFGAIQTNLPSQIRTFYQSDSFVLPEFRGRGCYPALMRAHSEFFHSMDEIPASLAVENEWQGLAGLRILLQRKRLKMRFVGTTTLWETYLLGRIEPPSGSVTPLLLKDWRLEDRQDFIESFRLAEQDAICVPLLSAEYMQRLGNLDPQARCFLVRQNGRSVAGAIAVDVSNLRTFRYIGKKSLMIEAVQQRRQQRGDPQLTMGDPLRFLNLCFCWHQQGAEEALQNILHHAHYWAEQAGYDGVHMRDIPENCIPEAIQQNVVGRWPNIMRYQRRSCLVMRYREEELMDQCAHAHMRWKWDSSII